MVRFLVATCRASLPGRRAVNKGQAMTEFVLVAPCMLLLCVVAGEMGRLWGLGGIVLVGVQEAASQIAHGGLLLHALEDSEGRIPQRERLERETVTALTQLTRRLGFWAVEFEGQPIHPEFHAAVDMERHRTPQGVHVRVIACLAPWSGGWLSFLSQVPGRPVTDSPLRNCLGQFRRRPPFAMLVTQAAFAPYPAPVLTFAQGQAPLAREPQGLVGPAYDFLGPETRDHNCLARFAWDRMGPHLRWLETTP